MLKGKHVLLGVTGGIAAYKAADLTSRLVKQHAEVNVIMTENATKFISPNTFEALAHTPVVTDTFNRSNPWEVEHISLAEKSDVVIIAPATANIIAKLAHGMADDMLTTTVLACDCPKILAPAMNTHMYENPVTQDNLNTLRHYGWEIVEPESGHLACGTTGKGKLVSPERLVQAIDHAISHEKDLKGKRILVTAGPTQEAIDPVRYLTNHSSGKMGYALAEAAAARGAEVTLVSGPTSLGKLPYVETVDIISARDMYEAVTSRAGRMDAIIMAAAVADFRPAEVADNKIKKNDSDSHPALALEETDDILGTIGPRKKDGQLLIGFSMETKNLIENSEKKLAKKNLDMVCANNLKEHGAGFQVDTNLLTLITKDGETSLPLMSKYDAANAILDRVVGMLQ